MLELQTFRSAEVAERTASLPGGHQENDKGKRTLRSATGFLKKIRNPSHYGIKVIGIWD